MTARRFELPGTNDWSKEKFFPATNLVGAQGTRFLHNVKGEPEPLTLISATPTNSRQSIEVRVEEYDFPIYISRTASLQRA